MTSTKDQRLETASGQSRRLLALLVGLLLTLAAIVSGAGPAAAQNAVGPQSPILILTVGPQTPAAPEGVGLHALPLRQHASATGVAAEAGGAARGANFIASSDGTIVSTSRARFEGGFRDAGSPSSPATSPGMHYTLPDGSLVRVMEASGQAPLRALFTDSYGNAINPFTGKQPQPPPGVSGAAWRQMMRDLTHVEPRP